MSLERAEWVVGYLVGKIVRIVDLKDFFTIQNNELKIKVEEISSKRYSYTFGGFTFIVDIEEVEKPKSSYKIVNVEYTSVEE